MPGLLSRLQLQPCLIFKQTRHFMNVCETTDQAHALRARLNKYKNDILAVALESWTCTQITTIQPRAFRLEHSTAQCTFQLATGSFSQIISPPDPISLLYYHPIHYIVSPLRSK